MRQKEAMDHNNNKKRRPCQYNSIGLQYKFWDKLRSSSEINGRKKKGRRVARQTMATRVLCSTRKTTPKFKFI